MKKWEELSLDSFTGPLDLLVTMVREKKVDILKVNLIELVDQYLNYIEIQTELDIEIASEYLSMSAHLIEMKAKLLLPKNEVLVDDDEFSYEDFLQQLSTYDQIKTITSFFADKQEEYCSTFSKEKSKIRKITTIEEDLEALIDPTYFGMDEFANIFRKIMAQSLSETSFDDYDFYEEESFSLTTTNVISPEEASDLIVEKMSTDKEKNWRLEELLDTNFFNIKNLISTFLSILDLVRYQVITINQIEDTLLVKFTEFGLENRMKIITENEEDRTNEQL